MAGFKPYSVVTSYNGSFQTFQFFSLSVAEDWANKIAEGGQLNYDPCTVDVRSSATGRILRKVR